MDGLFIDDERISELTEDGYVAGIPPASGPYRHLEEALRKARSADKDNEAGLLLVLDRRTAFRTFAHVVEAARSVRFDDIRLAVHRPDATLGAVPLEFQDPAAAGEPNRGEGRDAPRVVVTPAGYEVFPNQWSKKSKPKRVALAKPDAMLCSVDRWAPELLASKAGKSLAPPSGAGLASVWADDEVPVGAVAEVIVALRALDCDAAGAGCRFDEVRIQAHQKLTADEAAQGPGILELGKTPLDAYGRPVAPPPRCERR